MTITIASDHAGFELKEHLKQRLEEQGWAVVDKGTNSEESTDYPEYAHALASDLQTKETQKGILICGSANGVSMSANKHAGIRAAIAWNRELAELARKHNDANVLSLPARFISTEDAEEILEAFLNTEFEGGRHQRRVDKINIERKNEISC